MKIPILSAALMLSSISGATGVPVDTGHCACNLPNRIRSELVTEAAFGNEELTFDAGGLLVVKKGEAVVRVPVSGPTQPLSRDPALMSYTFGIRRMPNGHILAAEPDLTHAQPSAQLLEIDPSGPLFANTTVFFSGSDLPANTAPFIVPDGLDVDSSGTAWVSDFATATVYRVTRHQATIVAQGALAQSVAGLAYDEKRGMLFYTSGSSIYRLRVGRTGAPSGAPELVANLTGTKLDGITLDACGNLYGTDSDSEEGRYKLWRLTVDAAGKAVGTKKDLATFNDWVSAVQFPPANSPYSGDSVFVSGIWGEVWRVNVGAHGVR